jgi:4-amino-4-deoxy-L-arabinose transferase-like glycosyltransferase
MTESTQSNKISPRLLLAFALCFVIVYLFGLDLPFLGPDEPRYTQVAREMFDRGDWVTPTLGGFDWFEKPALLYWLQMTFFNVFGVNEFAARFGSALFGIGTTVALFILAKNLGRRHGLSDIFPAVTLIAGASTIGLIAFARGASFDIIVTFPLTASLVCFYIAENTEDKESRKRILALLGFYAFAGLATIAKGLVGIVFPGAIVTFYYLLVRRFPSRVMFASLVWGPIATLAVAALWYYPMYQVNGWKFIDEFFIQHHFQRYASNKYLHPQPFWFFWVVFPLMTIPWIPFFFKGLWRSAKNFVASRKGESIERSDFRIFTAAWMLVPLVFFSLSGSKLPGYVLPALPAGILFTAEVVDGFIAKKSGRIKTVFAIAFGTLAFAAILIAWPLKEWSRHDSAAYLVEAATTQGYKTEKILNLHMISHSLEFYGAGRLVRTQLGDGKQRRFDSITEIESAMAPNEKQVLVILPTDKSDQIEKNTLLAWKKIGSNVEKSFYLLRRK